jgi:hypothetical protein
LEKIDSSTVGAVGTDADGAYASSFCGPDVSLAIPDQYGSIRTKAKFAIAKWIMPGFGFRQVQSSWGA